jgi:hypothetical protein
LELNPFEVRFTHDRISPAFRSGTTLDEAIRGVASGAVDPFSFPFIEVVEFQRKFYSISSRRLYMFRVLAQQGLVKHVKVIVHPLDSPRMQQKRYDARLRREAPKWERAFSTRSDGMVVHVRSEFSELQTRHPVLSQSFGEHTAARAQELRDESPDPKTRKTSFR